MEQGRIVKAISGFFYVQSISGIISCKGRGILKKKEQIPLVGDQVLFTITDRAAMEGMLEEVLPRFNELIRPPAANVDQLLIVFSYTHPAPNYVLLDRILMMAESQHLPALICFNKVDLAEQQTDRSLKKAYETMGYAVIETSAKSGDGLSVLKQALRHRTTALAGTSGVGKSTLINSMFPHFSLETGRLSQKIQRGRHTTRHSELHQIDETTWIMDTPGFSTLSVDYLDETEVRDCFRDFEALQTTCRFHSCLHLEEPGCSVKNAVKEGGIHPNRYQNYVTIIKEIRKNRRY
jgi:ribosome biogenesis GTPase / thiamine phosphate phosphatase